MMLKGPIALATIRTSAVLGCRLIVQAATLLLITRILGPEHFGAFAGVAALAVMLGTLSTFGTHLVLWGRMSREPAQRIQVLRYALPTTLLCGGGLLVVFLLCCTYLLQVQSLGWGVLLAIGLAEMLLLPLLTLVVVESLALEHTARSQVLQTLPLLLRLIVAGVIALLQLPDPLMMYSYGYCFSAAVALLVASNFMEERWPSPRTWRWPTLQEIRESSSFAVLNITAMGPAELDKTLASKLLPLSAAGLYAAGARIVGAVTLPVIALMLSALPRLFRESGNQGPQSLRLLCWVFGATALYSIGLAAALWWFAPLFAWGLGASYDGVEDAIRWLCLAVPGMALRIAAGSVLMAQGQPWWRAGYEVIGLVVLTISAVVFTARLGGHGMPLALVCSEWSMAALGGCLVVRMQLRA